MLVLFGIMLFSNAFNLLPLFLHFVAIIPNFFNEKRNKYSLLTIVL